LHFSLFDKFTVLSELKQTHSIVRFKDDSLSFYDKVKIKNIILAENSIDYLS